MVGVCWLAKSCSIKAYETIMTMSPFFIFKATNSFSFNSTKGYCKQCKGLGKVHKFSIDKIIPDKSISIQNGAIKPIRNNN